MNDSQSGTVKRRPELIRYAESLAIAAAFMHAGQDLMRGEPAELGIPPWLFAGGFFGYAVLLAATRDRPSLRALLAGGVPLAIGVFHIIQPHSGGFFMPVTYATILFGSATLLVHLSRYRHA
ncbi:hypothetical protein [Halovenus halobia]|uniref:hypothetical protein n=1 Tax=Halovenus halobia TaxID=3396622 RepID=UPI003F544A37